MVLCLVHRAGLMGALGAYGRMAAEQGLMAFVAQRTRPIMSLTGIPAIGNIPLAFGAPVPGSAPLVFDVACSVAARMKVELAARESAPIPSETTVACLTEAARIAGINIVLGPQAVYWYCICYMATFSAEVTWENRSKKVLVRVL